MTIGEIVGEGLDVHSNLQKSRKAELIAESLEAVEINPDDRFKYPHEFSGGQRQRISIARAMVLRPKLIVLDEPTSALDLSVQGQIVELLRNLQEKYQLAFLFVSHDLKVVRAMSHRIIVMKDGLVIEEGEAEQIITNPQASYTKSLMAAAFN